jgi:4-hydroxybenzoate polyprenyltransferase
MVKLSLGDSYENTVIPEKIRAYGDITKPASSIGVMAAIPFASIIYGELYSSGGPEFLLQNLWTVVYASVTIMLLHGGSQALNMAEDAEADRQTDHKQNRPIPAGVISEEEARSLAWIFISVGLARAFTITSSFGIFALVLAFNGVFYNLDPIRAKERLWVNVGWQAASRGLLLYPASFAIWGDPLNQVAWAMGLLSFFLVLSMQQTADFNDAEIDEKFGIITPAVYHDFNSLISIMAGIVLTMFAFMLWFVSLQIIPNFWSLFILVIPIAWSLYYLWDKPGGVSNVSGQSPTWYIFYLCLASMYILPAVQLMLEV